MAYILPDRTQTDPAPEIRDFNASAAFSFTEGPCSCRSTMNSRGATAFAVNVPRRSLASD